MHPSIASPRKHFLLTALLILALSVAGANGGFSLLVRGGGAVLEFVGHLISGFHDFSLDRLDPTYPRCF
ncbi:hypothetical protein [Terriglobus saanensis]|uniref:Uncharacterized protein n=1 Tax=Terriglobus saanensis (strain ATCC BAA-1853 / DSM 23119 / SP1PR4) TaxID=401053 RepID=E8V525_TERSS|nr:hypothetical protein [Terriglobus saanensis]ADV83712.1 hypothetical protein AciPR4_2952 [Terriglobus saanensis SP1PR4]